MILRIKEKRLNDPKNSERQYEFNNATIKIAQSTENFSITNSILSIFIKTFLPAGYPNSVRSEYLSYQFWDSLKGLCSYLRSVFSIQAILIGAGVGNSEASAIATTLAWVMKDGIGMLGSLLFAYLYSDTFEVNVKEWRLVADVLCNIALTFDMLLTFMPDYFFEITSISSVCKSCCGLVAGATKARISAHFANKGHLADVTAKESTQETAVTLIGLVIGIFCTKYISISPRITWILFITLSFIHQYANYELVRVLVLDTYNPQRLYLIVKYILNKKTNGCDDIPTPKEISKLENIFRPMWLDLYGPQLGCKLSCIFDVFRKLTKRKGEEVELWDKLCEVWKNEPFVISIDIYGRFIICLKDDCVDDTSLIKSYTLAFYLMNYSPSNDSTPNWLHEKLYYIINYGANASLSWYSENIQTKDFTKFEWSSDSASSHLGDKLWRYSPNTKKIF